MLPRPPSVDASLLVLQREAGVDSVELENKLKPMETAERKWYEWTGTDGWWSPGLLTAENVERLIAEGFTVERLFEQP